MSRAAALPARDNQRFRGQAAFSMTRLDTLSDRIFGVVLMVSSRRLRLVDRRRRSIDYGIVRFARDADGSQGGEQE